MFIKAIIVFFILSGSALAQTPIPTPAGDDGEEWLEYINSFPDREEWPETNYDPIQTRRGTHFRVKDIVVQSVEADAAVMLTCGYNNIFYNGDRGDIRGLAFQGYIDIVSTAVAYHFRLMDLIVSSAYAKSGKWKQTKAIKKLDKLQKKPKKPKKVKWKTEDGLKKKKEKFNNE